jgi:protein-S-isoprenylcysteine O-methyltransferase Ste14
VQYLRLCKDLVQSLSSGSEENVILLVSLLWLVCEIVGGKILPRLRGEGSVKARGDSGSRLIIMFSILLSIAIASYFGKNGVTPLPDVFFYAGIVLMLAGIVFRQYSIWVLGRFFSTSVRILSDHRMVTNGPYHFIRHPSYTGALLTFVGLGLASRTLGGTTLIVALFGLVYGYRIDVEEKALKTEFGQAYVDYAKKTKRLIPFVL